MIKYIKHKIEDWFLKKYFGDFESDDYTSAEINKILYEIGQVEDVDIKSLLKYLIKFDQKRYFFASNNEQRERIKGSMLRTRMFYNAMIKKSIKVKGNRLNLKRHATSGY